MHLYYYFQIVSPIAEEPASSSESSYFESFDIDKQPIRYHTFGFAIVV